MFQVALLAAFLSATGFAQEAPPAAAQTTPPAKPATPAGPRPVEDFAALPAIENPEISPDGKQMAARFAVGGKLYFGIIPLDGTARPRLMPSEYDLNSWEWVNNDWLAVSIGDLTAVEGDEWYITRVISVSADATKVNMISPRDAGQSVDMIWSARDGSPRVLLAAQTSIYSSDPGFWRTVYEVNVATGKSRVAVRPQEGVQRWVADGTGAVRMGFGRSLDGRKSHILYRAGGEGGFRTVARARTNDDDGEDFVIPSLFLAEPGKAIAYANDDEGFGGIYAYDLNTLQRGKLLYASPGYDMGGIIASRNRDALAGVSYEETRSRVQWVDPDLAKLQAEVSGKIRGAHAAITSYSDDHQRAIVLVSGPDSPGAYFLYERATQDMTLVGEVNPTISLSRLHPVKTIRYKARDGLEIPAILTLPRGKTSNLPLIVMPHGGPAVRDSEAWDWWAQFLADRGYAVIQPNYRGSTGYGDRFTEKGEGQWGLAMQDDLNDAITHLAKEGVADPKRVCMVGASYGGYAALRAAQRDSALYRCAVSYAGVSDLGAMKRYDSRFLNSGATGDWLKEQAPDFRAVSPVFGAASFDIPVLIMHGRKDRVVPFAQSREMAEKLRAAGKPVTFIEQKEGDHHFSRGADRLEFLKALEVFLKQHNPA